MGRIVFGSIFLTIPLYSGQAAEKFDTWDHIRCHITQKSDKDRFSLVCKVFRDIDAQQTRSLILKCTSLQIHQDNLWDQHDPDTIEAMLDTKSRYGCTLSNTGKEAIEDTGLEALANRFPNIKVIDLSGRRSLGQYYYLPRIVPWNQMFNITIEGLKSFTNLTTLILGNYSNIKSENICELEKIETLDLWESQNFDYGNIGSIITKFPKIKILIDKENFNNQKWCILQKNYFHFVNEKGLPYTSQ